MNRQRLVMVIVTAVASIFLLLSGRRSGDVSGPAARAVSDEPAGWVRISGDVRSPGAYPVSANNMTNDVIALANPACAVDQAGKRVYAVSGAHFRVVCPGDGGQAVIISGTMSGPERLALNIPIDLNQATAGDLESIPGIGPVMAQRILRYRQNNGDFGRLEELLMVEGIGEKKLQRLRNYLQVVKIKGAP